MKSSGRVLVSFTWDEVGYNEQPSDQKLVLLHGKQGEDYVKYRATFVVTTGDGSPGVGMQISSDPFKKEDIQARETVFTQLLLNAQGRITAKIIELCKQDLTN